MTSLVSSQTQRHKLKKGWEYNEDRLTARFAEMDADNNDIATTAERKAWHANRKKNK